MDTRSPKNPPPDPPPDPLVQTARQKNLCGSTLAKINGLNNCLQLPLPACPFRMWVATFTKLFSAFHSKTSVQAEQVPITFWRAS